MLQDVVLAHDWSGSVPHAAESRAQCRRVRTFFLGAAADGVCQLGSSPLPRFTLLARRHFHFGLLVGVYEDEEIVRSDAYTQRRKKRE